MVPLYGIHLLGTKASWDKIEETDQLAETSSILKICNANQVLFTLGFEFDWNRTNK